MNNEWIKAFDVTDGTFYTFKLSDVTALRHKVGHDDNKHDEYGIRVMVDVFEQDVVEIEVNREQYDAISHKLEIEELPGYQDVNVDELEKLDE